MTIPHNKIESDLCSVKGCDHERAPQSNGTRRSVCSGHYARKQRTGSYGTTPIRAMVPRNRPDVWCSYEAAHNRVKNARGKASGLPCADCGSPAAEWSYRGDGQYEFTGPHSRGSGMRAWSGDPADYDPRCTPCHRAFDH